MTMCAFTSSSSYHTVSPSYFSRPLSHSCQRRGGKWKAHSLLSVSLLLFLVLFPDQLSCVSAQEAAVAANNNGGDLSNESGEAGQNSDNIKLSPQWYDSLFAELDVNHDGLLDLKEYKTGRISLQEAIERHAQQHPRTMSSWLTLKGFWKAFTSAVAMIFATEVGDKTFFIAAVLSMKFDRSAVYSGAIFALIVMTILSTAMGLVLPVFMSRQYTHILGGILFLYFGYKMFTESMSMEAGRASDELEEVEEELLQQNKKKDTEDDVESGINRKNQKNVNSNDTKWLAVCYQAMTLIFVAEWGDRSQIATIALGAAKNPVGVMVGGSIGHMICTGLAVLGGRMLAARISEKTVNQWGGIIFFIFGIHSLFFEE